MGCLFSFLRHKSRGKCAGQRTANDTQIDTNVLARRMEAGSLASHSGGPSPLALSCLAKPSTRLTHHARFSKTLNAQPASPVRTQILPKFHQSTPRYDLITSFPVQETLLWTSIQLGLRRVCGDSIQQTKPFTSHAIFHPSNPIARKKNNTNSLEKQIGRVADSAHPERGDLGGKKRHPEESDLNGLSHSTLSIQTACLDRLSLDCE